MDISQEQLFQGANENTFNIRVLQSAAVFALNLELVIIGPLGAARGPSAAVDLPRSDVIGVQTQINPTLGLAGVFVIKGKGSIGRILHQRKRGIRPGKKGMADSRG